MSNQVHSPTSQYAHGESSPRSAATAPASLGGAFGIGRKVSSSRESVRTEGHSPPDSTESLSGSRKKISPGKLVSSLVGGMRRTSTSKTGSKDKLRLSRESVHTSTSDIQRTVSVGQGEQLSTPVLSFNSRLSNSPVTSGRSPSSSIIAQGTTPVMASASSSISQPSISTSPISIPEQPPTLGTGLSFILEVDSPVMAEAPNNVNVAVASRWGNDLLKEMGIKL